MKSVAVMSMMFAQATAPGWTSQWSALFKIGCSRRGTQERWRQWGRCCNPSAHARCHLSQMTIMMIGDCVDPADKTAGEQEDILMVER